MADKKLDIAGIFKTYATDIVNARAKALQIHGTADIKAAGNEIEEAVRIFFKSILPKRYNVTHGHLIDMNGMVSPQLDLIISDNNTMPSLFTTKDGTEYVPIDSVYAICEIKSAYYKSKAYIPEFSRKIKEIRDRLYHPLVRNTAYGNELRDDTRMDHVFLSSKNKFLNKIFSFLFCIDKNDFDFIEIGPVLKSIERVDLPNMAIFLNSGALCYGAATPVNFTFQRYPDEIESPDQTWHYVPCNAKSEAASIEGNTLSFIYYALLNHLENSHLEPPNLDRYMGNTTIIDRDKIQTLKRD